MASLRQQLEEAQQKVLLEQKRQQDEEINHGEMIKELKSCLIKEKEKYNILNIKVCINYTFYLFTLYFDS